MERTTVGSLLRSTQAFCIQLCDKHTLDFGIAYHCARFADLPEVNQYREVIATEPAEVAAAFDEAERCFRDEGLSCHSWAPADGQATGALADFLAEHGYARRNFTVLRLAEWVDLAPDESVRVLPARAMRTVFRETYLHAETPADLAGRTQLADAYTERLDDPQFDMFVALVDKQPAGRCALYQVGDIARIMAMSVLPGMADRGVERALLAPLLALAKRLAMRNVCTLIDAGDEAHAVMFREAGFVEDGTIVEFHRDRGETGAALR